MQSTIKMTNKSMYGPKKKDGGAGRGLLDVVLSWSIVDVLNNDLFKDKVKQIPDSFSSTAEYFNAFLFPLMEETRADFCSGLGSIAQAPACEVSRLVVSKGGKSPKEMVYKFVTKGVKDSKDPSELYEPGSGDVIILTKTRPRGVEDLTVTGEFPYLIAVVQTSQGSFTHQIVASRDISSELRHMKNKTFFGTYMMNLTTNMRIWEALTKSSSATSNLTLIRRALRFDSSEANECSTCLSKQNSALSDLISSFNLDKSQKHSIMSSISMNKCSHNASKVQLIWGPPGTGKTKTVASMLFALLRLKTSTLTCAPTNIAVLQVAKRLIGLFLESNKLDTYGMGDIVLFGNGERMQIDDHPDLVDVFLDYRIEELSGCIGGWKSRLDSMLSFVKDPMKEYRVYKRSAIEESSKKKKEKVDDHHNDKNQPKKEHTTELKKGASDLNVKGSSKNRKKQRKAVNNGSLKENGEKNRCKAKGNDHDSICQGHHSEEQVISEIQMLTFEEFVEQTFNSLAKSLMHCAKSLYTHLPTSCLPQVAAKLMITLLDQLENLLNAKEVVAHFSELTNKRRGLINILNSLQEKWPEFKFKGTVRDLCLSKACLIFCTASSSIKVKSKLDLVIIDEAAQLKECESAIPLLIPGVKVAVLVGDDRQLPAMVLDNTNFGRSLFQRLASLGKPKHLLNTQYRMHWSISLFPNTKFYDSKILDAPHVKDARYPRSFLDGNMYGSYSFINVGKGKETFRNGHSPRNLEEAAVVDRIIAKLFKAYFVRKQKISVGVISPYKGQANLIQEKLGNKYANYKEDGFSVSVRSVDGFQGGEEDVIIISTVRCNRNGSVGFLSNHQRTNVALTRARYCLWIVGNAQTLVDSKTVWKDIVIDARERGCFYNVEQETSQGNVRHDYRFLEVGKTRWKIFFNDDFKMSISAMKSKESQTLVMEVLKKVANGWRQPPSKEQVDIATFGMAAELLELYKVVDKLYLAWTVDVQKEGSNYTQVIKVWDVLPASKITKLAKDLDLFFGSCTVDFINRCKHKSSEGTYVVPMSRPCHSAFSALPVTDPEESLSRRLAALNLGNDPRDCTTRFRSGNSNPRTGSQIITTHRKRG